MTRRPVRLEVLFLTWLSVSLLSGCQDDLEGDSSGVPAGRETAGSSARPDGINAEPFETIALASDTTHEALAIPQGTDAGQIEEFTPLGIKFVWCPPGTFLMGSAADAFGTMTNESQVQVTLTNGFWIQQTELTQSQYNALMGTNPAFHKGEMHPVETVSWDEANEFCRRLSELPPEKSVGNVYRLPTEAEWEYACRSGTTTVFSFGDDDSRAEDFGWFNLNSDQTTHPVAGKEPGPWGLYDMHGNVSEWCQDYYGAYPTEPVTDPTGVDSGEKRVLRGGGWFYVPENARSPHRDAYPASARYIGLGFRMVAEPAPQESSDNAAVK